MLYKISKVIFPGIPLIIFCLVGGGGNKQHLGSRDSAAVCRDTEETKSKPYIVVVDIQDIDKNILIINWEFILYIQRNNKRNFNSSLFSFFFLFLLTEFEILVTYFTYSICYLKVICIFLLVETVSLDVGKLIQKGRTEKGLTQKELATVSKKKKTGSYHSYLSTLV